MRLYDVVEIVERIAPLAAQADWDKSGLQVAASRQEIHKMAVCLDALPAVVEKALDDGAEFILSHHPLSLHPQFPNRLDAYHRVLQLLLSANVPLYAAHTSLDINIDGPAGWLGDALYLQNTEPLDPVESSLPCSGYGEIGDLPEPTGFNQLVSALMELLEMNTMKICGPPRRDIIRRVAYCGGSGSDLAKKAFELGADIFITGDVKYHSALESPISILDVGHYSLEMQMMRHVTRILKNEMPDLELIFIVSQDPFKTVYNI